MGETESCEGIVQQLVPARPLLGVLIDVMALSSEERPWRAIIRRPRNGLVLSTTIPEPDYLMITQKR